MKRPLLALWLLVLGGASVCAGLLSIDDAAIALIYMTCGLGLPFLLAPAMAAYLGCLAPFMLLRTRWMGAMASAVVVLGFAVLPGAWSHRAASVEAARAQVNDLGPVGPVLARSLQIERPATESLDDRHPFFGEEPCDAPCRALLLGGEIDWLRVVTIEAARGKQPAKVRDRVRLVAAVGADCAEPDGPVDADARCVVFTPDDDAPPDLFLRLEDGRRGADGVDLADGWASSGGFRRVTAWVGAASAEAALLVRTEVHFRVVFMPSLPEVPMQGMSSGGIGLVRTGADFGKVELPMVLRELGFPLVLYEEERVRPKRGSWRDAPLEESTRQVVSILDLPAETPLSEAQQQVVAQWVMAARAWSNDGGWTQGRLEVLRRVVGDERVQRAWALDQIVERSPSAAEVVMPVVLERTEARGLPRDAPWSKVWYGLGRADPSVLTPHSARIAALLDAHRDERALVVLAGRLGIDPSPWLLPLDADLEDRVLTSRLNGVCRADAAWGEVLVPQVQAFAEGLDPSNGRHEDRVASAARALVRHGASDAAFAILARWGDDGARETRRIQSDLKRQGPTDAICR